MIDLNKLKNKHLNEDIYVVGSGPSLNHIDGSFWDNKIVICVNATIELDCIGSNIQNLYYIAKESTEFQQTAANKKKATIVMSKYRSGKKSDGENKIRFPDRTILFAAKSKIIQDKKQLTQLERSSSTIISAMHLAIIMGVKNIMVAGHDCGAINGERHVAGYNKAKAVIPTGRYHAWMIGNNVEDKTIAFKKVVKEIYDVNICSLNPFINFNLEGNTYRHWEPKKK